jgi:hypothetical protein
VPLLDGVHRCLQPNKLCHPDRSAAKQAKWRDLLLGATRTPALICLRRSASLESFQARDQKISPRWP